MLNARWEYDLFEQQLDLRNILWLYSRLYSRGRNVALNFEASLRNKVSVSSRRWNNISVTTREGARERERRVFWNVTYETHFWMSMRFSGFKKFFSPRISPCMRYGAYIYTVHAIRRSLLDSAHGAISYLLIYTRARGAGKIAEVAQSLSIHFRERLLVKNSADIGCASRGEDRLNLFPRATSRVDERREKRKYDGLL